MFAFERCSTWLRDEADRLSGQGYDVEVRENSEAMHSLLLRASSVSMTAELLVWVNGNTSAMVYCVPEDRLALDRHDVVLSDETFKDDLSEFFRLLR